MVPQDKTVTSPDITSRKLKVIYDTLPPNLYESARISRIYHSNRYRVAAQYLRDIHGLILDVGCNGGLFANLLAKGGRKVVGLDISSSFLRHAHRLYRGTIDFVLGDAQMLPFPKDVFDGISCLEVLEHVIMPEKVIREIFRVLKPGGKAIFMVPNEEHPLYKIIWSIWRYLGRGRYWNGLHLHVFDKRALCNVFSSNGFSIKSLDFCNFGMLLIIKAVKPRVES